VNREKTYEDGNHAKKKQKVLDEVFDGVTFFLQSKYPPTTQQYVPTEMAEEWRSFIIRIWVSQYFFSILFLGSQSNSGTSVTKTDCCRTSLKIRERSRQ
jgi:hypothetical protein